jgi:hypothetical protein
LALLNYEMVMTTMFKEHVGYAILALSILIIPLYMPLILEQRHMTTIEGLRTFILCIVMFGLYGLYGVLIIGEELEVRASRRKT